jgi:hypothetical protein
MDEKRTWTVDLEQMAKTFKSEPEVIAVAERLEAIVEELGEISKGLRFMGMAAGLEKLAKTPEILKQLLSAAGGKAPPSDSPPSKS